VDLEHSGAVAEPWRNTWNSGNSRIGPTCGFTAAY